MTVITPDDKNLGGMQYPLLQGSDWKIVTSALSDDLPVKSMKLRLVRQDKVVDIYCDQKPPLKLSMSKGGFVLSKRVSRIMRPYYFWGLFNKVNIRYDESLDKKTWDGAGLISRRFLRKLTRHLPEARKDELRRRLMRTGRVEFTVLSKRGEDKGHALVVDDLDADLVLPCDTKTELKLTEDYTFIGVQPIHAARELWVDVQSIINLHPFMDADFYLPWLRSLGEQHLKRIEVGGFDDMRSMKGNWWVAEYLMSGGKAMWFAGVVKALANTFSGKVEARALRKWKLPVPGERLYVMVDSVGSREIPVGHVDLDMRNATAWISHKDWVELSTIWGGADQDDSLLCLPFHDHDGDLKVLLWRNPNQPGEYAVLRPTDQTIERLDYWHELDSRQLPVRIDRREHTYLYTLEPEMPKHTRYSLKAMNTEIEAARRNTGMPGMYVNLLMVLQATTGELPKTLPARVEDVMDAIAKTGADTTPVKKWIYNFAYHYFPKHPEVPANLVRRVEKMLPEEMRDRFTVPEDNWFDALIESVEAELKLFQEKRDALAKKAMPPVQVFEYGQDHTREAGVVRAAYSAPLRFGSPKDEDFELARQASLKALRQFPQQDRVLAGIVLRAYAYGEEQTSDAVIWQKELVPETLEMLRRANVILTPDNPVVKEFRESVAVGVPILIRNVWFDFAKARRKNQGREIPATMGEIPKAERDHVKQLTDKWSRGKAFVGQKLVVGEIDGRKVFYRNNHLFGFVDKHYQDRLTAESVEPIWTGVWDGNVVAIV